MYFSLSYLLRFDRLKKYIYFSVIFLIINLYSLIKNHPYQYTFYNSLITKKNSKNFELDYWGVSNLDILKKIDNLSNKDYLKIYIFSVSPYHLSVNMIDAEFKKKYIFVDNISEADFIVTNHYYQDYY